MEKENSFRKTRRLYEERLLPGPHPKLPLKPLNGTYASGTSERTANLTPEMDLTIDSP